jgi:DNA-binding Lrp family transcriptional regulator
LFLWILYALRYRGDVVELDFKKMKNVGFQMSPGTFRKSIQELEGNRIIKRIGAKKDDDYWKFFINPQIIFKGDAKGFYSDVIKYHPEYL